MCFFFFFLCQPLGKGLLQRLLLNLCAHSVTRATLVHLLLDMIKPEAEGSVTGLASINSQRLYGCQSNVVYGRSQLLDGITSISVICTILSVAYYISFYLLYFSFLAPRSASFGVPADS